MASKTITLSLDAYRSLSRLKEGDESFSDVVERLANRARPLTDFAGGWEDVPSAKIEELERFLSESGRLGWERLRREVGTTRKRR
jgi:predicted CopG family antitoxin